MPPTSPGAAVFHENADLPLLRRLGDLVDVGGGDALLKLLADARAGRRMDI